MIIAEEITIERVGRLNLNAINPHWHGHELLYIDRLIDLWS